MVSAMGQETPTRGDEDTFTTESVLLSGVRTAISNAQGSMDQGAIDEALGVTRQQAADSLDAPAPAAAAVTG